MGWKIHFQKQPLKELEKMSNEDRERILRALKILRNNPYDMQRLNTKQLKGRNRNWRLRVGKYRIIYELFDAQILIDVIKIGPRGDVYKDS